MNKPVKNTPPSNNLRGVAVTAPQSHRERDDAYRNVVAQLAPRWRVIVCKDGIQWILQRKEASHGGPWRGMSYHTNRDGLIKVSGSLNLLSDANSTEILGELPEHISQTR